MDQSAQLLILILVALIGIFSTLVILRRQRVERDEATRENPLATSTEGEKICPKCGMGNMWTDRNCISCGTRLRG